MTTRADLIETVSTTLREESYWDKFNDQYVIYGDKLEEMSKDILDAVLPQITTAEQAEALPVNSRLVGPDGAAWRRPSLEGYLEKLGGHDEGHWDAEDALRLGPLTVVWRPRPDQETADA